MFAINNISKDEQEVFKAFLTVTFGGDSSISPIDDFLIIPNAQQPGRSKVLLKYSGVEYTTTLGELSWKSPGLPPAKQVVDAVLRRKNAGAAYRPAFKPGAIKNFTPVVQPAGRRQSPGPARVPQIGWAEMRIEVARRQESMPQRRKHSVYNASDRPKCFCPAFGSSETGMCDHIFEYYFAMNDAEVLSRAARTRKDVHVPLCMGYLWTTFSVHPFHLGDTHEENSLIKGAEPFAEIGGEVLINLASSAGGYEVHNLRSYRLAPGEGILPAIRYIEDLAKETAYFKGLSKQSPETAIQTITTCCTRANTHGVAISASLAKGLSPSNKLCHEFIVANSISLSVYGRCIPCQRAVSGTQDVPQF